MGRSHDINMFLISRDELVQDNAPVGVEREALVVVPCGSVCSSSTDDGS